MQDRRMDLFMLGLVSVLDAMLGCPLEDVLDHLPSVLADVKEALLGGETTFGTMYQLVVSYEQGDCTRLPQLTESLGLSPQKVMECYCQAIKWADQCHAAAA